jgi:hypothetical protein
MRSSPRRSPRRRDPRATTSIASARGGIGNSDWVGRDATAERSTAERSTTPAQVGFTTAWVANATRVAPAWTPE